jgi:hypothetical protein
MVQNQHIVNHKALYEIVKTTLKIDFGGGLKLQTKM